MSERQDVLRNFGFRMDRQGEQLGYFTRIAGLGQKVETIAYRQGGDPSTVMRLPGRTSIRDITLSMGVSNSDTLWSWLQSAVDGAVQRYDVSIIALDTQQSEVMRWSLANAWISECHVADFDALANEVLIENMTLVAERLERGGGD